MTDADIARLRAEFQQELARLSSESDLQSLRDKYLGRKGGAVTALMKSMASASVDVRPALGKLINELKTEIETHLSERKATLEATRAPVGAVDITLPGRRPPIGHRHPLTIVREQIEGIPIIQAVKPLRDEEAEARDFHGVILDIVRTHLRSGRQFIVRHRGLVEIVVTGMLGHRRDAPGVGGRGGAASVGGVP